MDSFDVKIGPCDRFNPESGYQIRVERNGRVILESGSHPVTGEDLTYETCVEVASFYGPARNDQHDRRAVVKY